VATTRCEDVGTRERSRSSIGGRKRVGGRRKSRLPIISLSIVEGINEAGVTLVEALNTRTTGSSLDGSSDVVQTAIRAWGSDRRLRRSANSPVNLLSTGNNCKMLTKIPTSHRATHRRSTVGGATGCSS
jgi:hypothetical protein